MAIEVYKRLNYLNEITEKLVELEASDDALRLTSFYGLTTKEICFKNLVKSFRWDKIKLKRCPKCHAYIDFNLARSVDRSEKRGDRQANKDESLNKSNEKIKSEPRAIENKEESLKKSESRANNEKSTRRGESQAHKNNVSTMESEPEADKNNEKTSKGELRSDKNNVKSMEGEPRANNGESKKRSKSIDLNDSSGGLNRKEKANLGRKANFRVKRKRLLIQCNQCKFTKSFAINSQYKTIYERLYSSYLSELK